MKTMPCKQMILDKEQSNFLKIQANIKNIVMITIKHL